MDDLSIVVDLFLTLPPIQIFSQAKHADLIYLHSRDGVVYGFDFTISDNSGKGIPYTPEMQPAVSFVFSSRKDLILNSRSCSRMDLGEGQLGIGFEEDWPPNFQCRKSFMVVGLVD
ncbi:hypothetical protein OIU78_015863 [Salix suchowensis]|nr:hypothetical protein OIU78_015863 [Salix suchowensis]